MLCFYVLLVIVVVGTVAVLCFVFSLICQSLLFVCWFLELIILLCLFVWLDVGWFVSHCFRRWSWWWTIWDVSKTIGTLYIANLFYIVTCNERRRRLPLERGPNKQLCA